MQRMTVKALVTSNIIQSVCLVGKGRLKERSGLESRTNFFFFCLRNRHKVVRIGFENIRYITPKLSSACYTMSSIKPFISPNTLETIYYSYFNTIINYGLPFWGNSSHSIKIFRMQKRIIRITTGCNSMVSCRNLFRRLEILPLVSQYILSLMLFVVTKKIFLF